MLITYKHLSIYIVRVENKVRRKPRIDSSFFPRAYQVLLTLFSDVMNTA